MADQKTNCEASTPFAQIFARIEDIYEQLAFSLNLCSEQSKSESIQIKNRHIDSFGIWDVPDGGGIMHSIIAMKLIRPREKD